MAEKKYYWLKLKRDFFKRHDIRIVEEMPNGKDYILFYLKLLVESVDHEGCLRFNNTIPYNDEMLATITNTNIDIVRAAMGIFTQLNMIEILDDGTVYMTEVLNMIGSAANNDNAIRQQRFRDKQKQPDELPSVAALFPNIFADSVTKNNASVTQSVTNNNESKSKSKSIEIEKESELDNKESKPKKTRFIPPTVDEVQAYCNERGNNVDAQRFVDYYTANGWVQGSRGKPIKNWQACVRTWEKNATSRPANSNRSGGNEFTALLENMGDDDE